MHLVVIIVHYVVHFEYSYGESSCSTVVVVVVVGRRPLDVVGWIDYCCWKTLE